MLHISTIMTCGVLASWWCQVAGLSWTDVTPHHDRGRGLREATSLLEEAALVRRLPSETVFIYHLEEKLNEEIKSLRSIDLPICTGGIATFQLEDSGLMPEELKKEIPTLRSFIGIAPDGISAELTVSPAGIRAQIWTSQGRCFVDPHANGQAEIHTAYHQSDVAPGRRQQNAGFPKPKRSSAEKGRGRRLADASGWVAALLPPEGFAETFLYRLVVACSYEYIEFAQDYGGGMALLISTLTRVNGIWGRESGIQFTLHPNQTKICSEDSNQIPVIRLDELPNNNNNAWMDGWPGQPKTPIDWLSDKGFDVNSYDIAHFFSVGDSGGLGGRFVCGPTTKANGGTAGEKPSGDSFDIEFVAHEMGHQFGTSHTWSGSKGSCTESQFKSQAAVELGSGSTLETYANMCQDDDIASASAPYFHVYSLAQFQHWFRQEVMNEGRPYGKMHGCGTYNKSMANRRPTVSAPASCSVPKSTPFILTGNGTDPDGDILSFNWEQLDASSRRFSIVEENDEGPLFISMAPSTSGNVRSFPKFSTVMANAGTSWNDPKERTSSEARSLHMALTARDAYNPAKSAGATWGTWHAAFTVVDVGKYGPLNITSPTSIQGVQTGMIEVSWEIAGPTGKPSSYPADAILMKSEFEVSYSKCVPDISGCGGSWTVLASNEKVSEQGRGSIHGYIPSSAAGNITFRVKATSGVGCEFYVVTPMLTATVGTVTTPMLVDTQPPANANEVPLSTARVTLSFSGIVWLQPSGIVVSIIAGGDASNFTAAQIIRRGANLDLPISPLFTASTNYNVTLTQGAICATPDFPCSVAQQITFASLTFKTAASKRKLSPLMSAPRRLSGGVIPFDKPMLTISMGTDVIIVGGDVIIKDSSGEEYCKFDVADVSMVTLNITSNSLVFDFTECAFWPGSDYSGSIKSASLEQLDGTPIQETSFTITTSTDTIRPVVESTDPANASAGNVEYCDITLSFSKYIHVANKNAVITLKSLTNGSADVIVPLSDCCDETNQILIYNDAGEVIITPKSQLSSRTTYSVLVPADAFNDYSMNYFEGWSLGQFVFTTGDTTPPAFSSVQFDAVGAGVSSTFCFDAGAKLSPGRGNFVLVDPTTNATYSSVGAASSSVTIKDNCVSVDFSNYPLPLTDGRQPARLLQSAKASVVGKLMFDGGVLRDDMGNGVAALGMNLSSPAVVVNASSLVTTPIFSSFVITVPNITLFLINPNNVKFVASSIAKTVGVPAFWVKVILSPSRRLQSESIRRLAGSVNVAYAIFVPSNAPDSQNITNLQATISKLQTNPAALLSAISNTTKITISQSSVIISANPTVTSSTASLAGITLTSSTASPAGNSTAILSMTSVNPLNKGLSGGYKVFPGGAFSCCALFCLADI